jgi:hypothetical protein
MYDQLPIHRPRSKGDGRRAFGPYSRRRSLADYQTGEIIEQYLDDTPYASCLLLGYTRTRRPHHLVCAPVSAEERLIVITTYQLDPNRWDPDLRRRKR